MARYEVVKGEVGRKNYWLYRFALDLTACVEAACQEVALLISQAPDEMFGTDTVIPKNSTTTPAGKAATMVSAKLAAPHSNAYTRHFAAKKGRTTRMDLGNLIEQVAHNRLRTYRTWKNYFLYNNPDAQPPTFPVNYNGAAKSARPDFRYPYYGKEAVFDITTPAEVGHLLEKTIGTTKIGNHPNIPVAVEVVWEDADLYRAGRRCGCLGRLWGMLR